MAINNVVVVGRLTKDVELKNVGETVVSNFTLAVDKPKTKDKDHPEANWIDCVAWGKTAEFLAKYFAKGNKVGITGSLQTRTYESNKSNTKVKVTEVFVNSVDFVESKTSKGENTSDSSVIEPKDNQSEPDATDVVEDDDPF